MLCHSWSHCHVMICWNLSKNRWYCNKKWKLVVMVCFCFVEDCVQKHYFLALPISCYIKLDHTHLAVCLFHACHNYKNKNSSKCKRLVKLSRITIGQIWGWDERSQIWSFIVKILHDGRNIEHYKITSNKHSKVEGHSIMINLLLLSVSCIRIL